MGDMHTECRVEYTPMTVFTTAMEQPHRDALVSVLNDDTPELEDTVRNDLFEAGLITAESTVNSATQLGGAIADLEQYSHQTDGLSGFNTFFGHAFDAHITDRILAHRARTGSFKLHQPTDPGATTPKNGLVEELPFDEINPQSNPSHGTKMTAVKHVLNNHVDRHLLMQTDEDPPRYRINTNCELCKRLESIQAAATYTASGYKYSADNLLELFENSAVQPRR